MIKHKKSIVFIILIIILISATISCNRHESDISVNDKMNYNILSRSEINHVLQKCRYDSTNTVCFSSVPLFSESSLYQMHWVLSIMTNIGIKPNTNNFINIMNSHNSYLTTENSLNDLNLIVSIYSMLHIDMVDKSAILDKLSNHYDSDTHLYFWKNIGETITDKISATYIAFDTYNKLNIIEKSRDLTISSLINLFNDDSFFTEDNANDTILNNGGCIINDLLISNIDINNINLDRNVVNKRLKWVKFWISRNDTSISDDFLSIFVLNQLSIICEFFNIDFKIPDKSFDQYFATHEKLSEISNGSNENYYIDPQFLNILITLCDKNKYPFPLLSDVDEYIKDQNSTNFVKNSNISPDIIDNYYGLLIANNIGFEYNTDGIAKLLNSFYNSFEENSNISDHTNFTDFYYLILSLQEQKISISSNKSSISDSIIRYIKSLNYDNLSLIVSNINDIEMALEINNILGLDINNEISIVTHEFLDKVYQGDEIYSRIYSVFICDINNLTDGHPYDKYNNKILSSLCNLKANGGYRNKSVLNEADISSTLLAVKTKDRLGDLESADKIEIGSFLTSLKSEKSILRLSVSSGSGASLKEIAELLEISAYCN